MNYEYRTSTKDAYKDPLVAEQYHTDFTGTLNWRRSRYRFIANRERHAVGSLLRLVDAKIVVDIPCGTGKLAPLLAARNYQVIAGDVSADMLEIARTSYGKAGVDNADFIVCDIETLTAALAQRDVDVVICLRLMHRVPRDVRVRMLEEIAKAGPFAIISFGVDSTYQAWRRKIRNKLFGGGEGEELCPETMLNILDDVNRDFVVVRKKWVSPLISEEVVFLLESKLRTNRT